MAPRLSLANQLSVGCGTTPRKLEFELYFYLFCINISLILNSFYNTALFDKKVSLFNLCVIRVGLNNAATSRILVTHAVILIFKQL